MKMLKTSSYKNCKVHVMFSCCYNVTFSSVKTTFCFLPAYLMKRNEYASWLLLSYPLWSTTVKGFSLYSEGKQVGAVRVTALIWCTAWRHYWTVRLHYGSVQITNISFFFFPKLLLCCFFFVVVVVVYIF